MESSGSSQRFERGGRCMEMEESGIRRWRGVGGE
jgi:hypothetical protein